MKICRKVQGILYFLGIREDGKVPKFSFQKQKNTEKLLFNSNKPNFSLIFTFPLEFSILHLTIHPLPNKLNLHIIL